MKKFIQLFYAYVILLFGSLLIYGCCDWEKRIIGADEIKAITLVDGTSARTDTIRAWFRISANFETETISMAPEVCMISSSYATSCDPVYLNELLAESLVVTCNQPMVVAGETIAAGTNLTTVPQIEIEISEEHPTVDVRFSQEMLDLSELTNGWNKFQLEIDTNDGVEIKDEIDLFFDFE